MSKFIRVDMTTKSAAIGEVPAKYAGIAGRALTSNFVNDEVKPTCHPLGKNNKLIFAPGFLTGTSAANSGRLSVGAKSPLTGTIKESNAGGSFAQKMARMGIKAIVIEGMPEDDKFYVVKVDMQGVTFDEAPSEILGGCGNYKAIEVLNAKYGDKVGIALAGPAGEYRLASANISIKDPESNIRSAGRGGLGAVMGSIQESKSRSPRRCGRAAGSAYCPTREVPRSGQGFRQSSHHPPRYQPGPAAIRHGRTGQHYQRSRRSANGELHSRPHGLERQYFRRDPECQYNSPRRRRQSIPRLPSRLYYPLFPALHRQEWQVHHQRL